VRWRIKYQLGMRGLTAQVNDLRSAITVLEQRCALRPGEVFVPPDEDVAGGPRRRSRRPVRGYSSKAQRFSKTRRLAALRTKLAAVHAALTAGRPSITVGGKRLWRNRQHLDAAEMTEQQWRGRWDADRSRDRAASRCSSRAAGRRNGHTSDQTRFGHLSVMRAPSPRLCRSDRRLPNQVPQSWCPPHRMVVAIGAAAAATDKTRNLSAMPVLVPSISASGSES